MQAAASLSTRLAGKYRGIVLAVACFLVFDLAVLVLNFVIAAQIAADAQAINLAGRQRMLSQRIAKDLFRLEADSASFVEPGSALRTELRTSAAMFEATLNALRQGGEVGGGDGTPVKLAPVQGERGISILREAAERWQPLAAALQPLAMGATDRATLAAAVGAARSADGPLLDLMNRLTSELESLARARSDRLRLVQTVGIVLALLNFCFILFKFMGRLSASDRETESARRETAQILGSVREGLFLIDRQRRIGTQATASLAGILGSAAAPGRPFADLLAELAPPADCKAAADFIDLLFEAKVKPALMNELNPLTQVQVPGKPARFLSFGFTAVPGESGAISHLLVTVNDISEQVRMEQDLASARHQAKNEIEMLLGMLGANPGALEAFAADAETALREANRRLRHPGTTAEELRDTVAHVFRLVHGIKGDAAAMGLVLFETRAHAFESLLSELRARPALRVEDLLGLPLQLEDFYERLTVVRAFGDQIARAAARATVLADEPAPQAAPAALLPAGENSVSVQIGEQLDLSLLQLTQRIAQDERKRVRVETDLEALRSLEPAAAKHVKDIALQLARNAVTHGIEAPEERERASKPAAGCLEVRLARVSEDEYELVLRDDGRGLNPSAIRAELTASGRYTPAQLGELDDRQVMMKIFEPGFSTAKAAGRDAGRGVGLDVVNDKIGRLGGHLRLASQPGRYTEFAVRFAA